ncbi:GNAT family N-acetyltransferase [Natrialbaceae archaeon A-gly3]
MSIDVRPATDEDRRRWNDYVARSPHGTFFHELEVLEVLADHAEAELHPLVGFKGEEPVGLFPVFDVEKRFVTAAFSPPPHLRVPYLGPAFLNLGKLKQRKRDRRRKRFVEGCFEWIETELAPRYAHVRTGTGVVDSRPFKWNGYEATPEYTYHVDLSPGKDDLLAAVSSDARRNVTNTPEEAYEIAVEEEDAVRRITEQVRHRYASQDIRFDPTDEFVVDLFEASEEGELRPYTLRVDDEFVGGILALEYDDTVSRWMGGVRTDADVDVPTNDLLDWAIISDGVDRGLATYDLVGADNPRINRYKSKFNPDLETYYGLEYGSWGTKTMAHLYNSVK